MNTSSSHPLILPRWSLAVLLPALVALVWLITPAPLRSADPASSTQWQYNTVSVDPAALQTTLSQMGNDGWEVFSIIRLDLRLDQDAEQKMHLRPDLLQVTGKRAKAAN